MVHREGNRLIIEPITKKRGLLETLAELQPLDEELPARSAKLGAWFMDRLRAIDSPHVEEVRGKGLMIGVVIKESSGPARPFCEALEHKGVLAKETHHQVIRFAPPLTITEEELEFALEQASEVLAG